MHRCCNMLLLLVSGSVTASGSVVVQMKEANHVPAPLQRNMLSYCGSITGSGSLSVLVLDGRVNGAAAALNRTVLSNCRSHRHDIFITKT